MSDAAPLRRLLEALSGLPASVWDDYALHREPLRAKLVGETRAELLAMAHRCGEELAAQVAGAHPGADCAAILRQEGAVLEFLPQSAGGSYAMFACFTEPRTVTVYQNTLDAARRALEREGCGGLLLGGADPGEVLLAHELFHWYEYRRPDLAVNQKVLPLWKLGGFTYQSRVAALGEVAAMAFAQRLLALSDSPYLLDVALLWPGDAAAATRVCNEILGLAGREPVGANA